MGLPSSLSHEGYSGNALCALNVKPTLYKWVDISAGGLLLLSPSSQLFGTDIFFLLDIFMLETYST